MIEVRLAPSLAVRIALQLLQGAPRHFLFEAGQPFTFAMVNARSGPLGPLNRRSGVLSRSARTVATWQSPTVNSSMSETPRTASVSALVPSFVSIFGSAPRLSSTCTMSV